VYVNEQRAIYCYIVHSAPYDSVIDLFATVMWQAISDFGMFITLWFAWVGDNVLLLGEQRLWKIK